MIMAHSGRQRVSVVWDYFKRLSNNKVRCNICSCELSFRGGSTSNLNRHIRLKHQFANLSEKLFRLPSNHEEDVSSNDLLQNNSVSRLEVIKSNKGHHKVIHLGFMYTKHKAMGDKIRWRCVQRSTHCKGSIFTSPDFREPRVTVNHNHVPDIDAVEFARCRTMIAERVNRFRIHPASEERPVEVKTEMLDVQDMMIPGPSSVDNFVELYLPRQRPSDWAVPQQAPPGTKQVMPPTPPPLKKSLPPASQPSPKPAIVKPAPSRPVSPPQPPPPPPEVCLRWNSYHSNMQATFPSLLNNEQFVDVTLACEGRSIKCHKMMLSACSSYFEELLSQNPCQHPIVLMKDLKFWEVQALVDFMYRGEVNVGQDKLPSLLAAAEALQIKGLAGPASTSSSHDEDSLPPSLPLSTEDYLDESASSPSSARRARKRRTLASMPTPQQNTVTPSRNPVGRPRLVRPSPQPSTSSYVASEPPLRRARRAEPIALPVGEIKVEPVDIDISNDSMGNDSMDPIDEGFDLKKNFEDGGTGEANDSSEQTDEPGGGGGGEDHEMTGSICDDNSALITGHDSDLEYGNNNGMTTEQADIGATDGQNSEIQGYSYTDGNDGGPGMSSSDINPSYPEVVLNPDNGSSDSILGHM